VPRKTKPESTDLVSLANVSSSPTWQQSQALQQVFDTVPQTEIIAALLDSGNDKAIQLAERLADSKYSRTNLAKHCADLKLLPKDVWHILIDTRKLSAKLVLSEKLTEIVQSVAEAAVTRVGDCPRCAGTGTISGKKEGDADVTCTLCNGSRTIVREADKDSQKMALEMGELLNVKVPLVAQQFNSYKSGSNGIAEAGVPNMTDWVRASDSIFEPKRYVEEAVIVETTKED
jgi:hypothetical protein